jgi:hypothetical protein
MSEIAIWEERAEARNAPCGSATNLSSPGSVSSRSYARLSPAARRGTARRGTSPVWPSAAHASPHLAVRYELEMRSCKQLTGVARS